MWQMLSQLVASKKFMASVGAVVAVIGTKVAGKFGLVLDPATADEISKIICVMAAVYVGAQGIADHGKEAVKLAVEAGAQTALKDAVGIDAQIPNAVPVTVTPPAPPAA